MYKQTTTFALCTNEQNVMLEILVTYNQTGTDIINHDELTLYPKHILNIANRNTCNYTLNKTPFKFPYSPSGFVLWLSGHSQYYVMYFCAKCNVFIH